MLLRRKIWKKNFCIFYIYDNYILCCTCGIYAAFILWVLTRNFYLSVEDTVFETYKNCVVIIPEPEFAIYFVLIGAGAFLLGAVSKSGLNVFLACIITAVVAIPQAWDLRYADEGRG